MTYPQRQAYCIGQTLLANRNNTEAWLHLAHVFFSTKIEITDLPHELKKDFENKLSTLNRGQCTLYCCDQVLKGKSTPKFVEIASNLIAATLKTMGANATNDLSRRIGGVGISTNGQRVSSIPTLNVRPIILERIDASPHPFPPLMPSVEKNGITNDTVTNLTLVLQKLDARLKLTTQKQKPNEYLDTIFSAQSNLTINEIKAVINDADCLVNMVNKISRKTVRLPFIYALFNDPNHESIRNPFRRPTDEPFLKRTIKTKDDFEKIASLMPKDTVSYQMQTRFRKYIKTSPHIRSLYESTTNIPSALVQHATPMIQKNIPPIQPPLLQRSIFSLRPILNQGNSNSLLTPLTMESRLINTSAPTPIMRQCNLSTKPHPLFPGRLFPPANINAPLPSKGRTKTNIEPINAIIDLMDEELKQIDNMEIETPAIELRTKRALENKDEDDEKCSAAKRPRI
ncbi:hypothetical protein [uncultured Legionella sp.]|uniref:hypothetical protein n=1 Tax=uncultured Legionella sp. TaxID=210934 RepID=UPI00261BFA35|nr:hypothetical protein [uncultured Legionella sp.]